MRHLTLLTASLALAFAGGCIDLPVDDWERGRTHGPGYYRTTQHKTPGGNYRTSESVQVIPGNAQTHGTTNIYVGSVYPNGYAVPVYPVYAGNGYGYGYGRGYGRGYGYGRGSNYNVQATGTYKGVNYGVGYGSNGYSQGGYGYANGTNGKTSWSASYGGGGGSPYGTRSGGRNSYGIYGNGNGNQGGNTTPSRFSTYR